jgi:DNA-binding CsgD family transcriptional regulator
MEANPEVAERLGLSPPDLDATQRWLYATWQDIRRRTPGDRGIDLTVLDLTPLERRLVLAMDGESNRLRAKRMQSGTTRASTR